MSRVPALRRALPAVALLLLLAIAAPAQARRPAAPHLGSVTCVRDCVSARVAHPGSLLRLNGRSFGRPMRAVFLASASGSRRTSALARVTSRTRASVRVPSKARGGVLYVRDRYKRRSNRVRRPLSVVRQPATTQQQASPTGTAFDGDGMWIWYVSKAAGGDPAAIAAQAQAHGIETVFVKAADGATAWTQFSPALISALKGAGLRVCAWQFAYGSDPEGEAERGAEAVRAGADCLVVDAESRYEGRYAEAQRYVTRLRDRIGAAYPLGLTSFPYVDYHPSLPYSVFLGPGGAQFNLPQVYWKAIGGPVDGVVDHTYRFNRPYARPIAPIGQLYDGPRPEDVQRFRALSAAAGSAGLSWWDWQHADTASWDAIAPPAGPVPAPVADWATLASGSKGDLVVWAQEHLPGVQVTGRFDAATAGAVQAAQQAAGLPVTGVVDTATWGVLLRQPAQAVDWSGASEPATASMAARRDELR